MRSGRSLIVLLVLALGLGAYIYFVENKRDVSETEKKDKVFTVDADKIEEIEAKASGGDVSTLKKNGSTWQVVAPVNAAADESNVGSMVSALASAEVTRVLDEHPANVSGFGLDPARYSVAFRAAGDAAQHRLNVGDKTPTGSDVYARVEGQTKVILIPSYTAESLNRTPFDLRDKTVLKFEQDKVDLITLEPAGAPKIALVKKGEDWRLTAPLDVRADASPVDALVSRLAQAQMKSVDLEGTDPTPAQLKTFGLDKPPIVATIGAGSTRATLQLGGKKGDVAVYARDLSRKIVFSVESSLTTDLTKKVDDLRIKDVFAFKAYTAKTLEIAHAGASFSFAKSAPPTAANATSSPVDVWKETKPDAKDVNATAMTDLLNTLSSLRAEKFADKAPASGDDIVIAVKAGDTGAETDEHLTLRKAAGQAYAIRAGEPGAAVVPVADVDKALEQLKALTTAK